MCLYAILWYEMIPRPGSCHCSLTEEVAYQVTLYLCSSLSIQKRLSPIQTTNLNRTSLIRKDLKQVICSTTRVYNAVCNFAEPQFFLPIRKSSSAMFHCSSDECILTSEAAARRFTGTYFSLWCLFSIDGFFSFCTHLSTHISNINMHTYLCLYQTKAICSRDLFKTLERALPASQLEYCVLSGLVLLKKKKTSFSVNIICLAPWILRGLSCILAGKTQDEEGWEGTTCRKQYSDTFDRKHYPVDGLGKFQERNIYTCVDRIKRNY